MASIVSQRDFLHRLDVQLLVVDDGSTDGSMEIIEDFLSRHPHLEIVAIRKLRNLGLKNSIELGLQLASGEYVQILASDDYLLDGKFRLQTDFLSDHPLLPAVYSGCSTLGLDGRLTPQSYQKFELVAKNGPWEQHKAICELEIPLPMGQSALFRSGALRESFQSTNKVVNDDWALLIELSRNNAIGFVNQPLVVYRIHQRNSHLNRPAMLINQLQVVSLLIDRRFQRRALASVLRIHALTYWTLNDRRAALYFSFLSFVTTGLIRQQIPYFVKAMRKAIGCSGNTGVN